MKLDIINELLEVIKIQKKMIKNLEQLIEQLILDVPAARKVVTRHMDINGNFKK
jgi:hypothetical protein